MMYPEYAEINGKKYKIDTNYETALRCFEIIEDEKITDYERALAIVYMLFEIVPKQNLDLFLEKAKIYLQCGKNEEKQKSVKKDMDFVQDRSYINSSFMSDYHIDLSKEKLHFWQFIELLEGLTEGCSLNRIRDIRNYDLSEEKDEKKKRKIKEIQQKIALKNEIKKEFTEEQIKAMEEFNKLAGL